MKKREKYGISTIAVHGKKHVDKHEVGSPIRALSTPIFQSSTFAFENADQGARIFAGEEEGFFYTRIGNPTTAALETEMAYLENTDEALAFASGMAAISTVVLSLARPGDNIVSAETLYGGTHKFFEDTLASMNIEAREVDGTDPESFANAADDKTRLIYFETPANPTISLVDIEAVVAIGKSRGIPVCVDNTFATPYLQSPMDLGADIVVHSATKYLGGHGDTVSGVVCGRSDYISVLRNEWVRDLGGIISPFNAWLVLRGIKTLPVRMDRHSDNALELAKFLSYHPKVLNVNYPGLRTHPQHELACRQMRKPGGMISFDIEGGREAGKKLMDSVELLTLAISLGDVDSLIEHPASMTHSTYSADQLAEAGIGEGLIRISVGLEDIDDLVYDLRQAFRRI